MLVNFYEFLLCRPAEGSTFVDRGPTGRIPSSSRKPRHPSIVALFRMLFIAFDWCGLKVSSEGPNKIKSLAVSSICQVTSRLR